MLSMFEQSEGDNRGRPCLAMIPGWYRDFDQADRLDSHLLA